MSDARNDPTVGSPDRPAKSANGGVLKDLVYGAVDGTVTTFAIVAGVEGAGLSHGVIVALGIANILADGFSMAAANYSGTKAELDDRRRIVRIEQDHIRNRTASELDELRDALARRGLGGDVLDAAVEAIAQKEDKWLSLILTDIHGLTRDEPHPMRAALATFGAFLVAGSVPLLPFVLGAANAFQSSIALTLATFFLIGTAKSRWSLSPWWRSGAETLLIGALAAAIAFGVGSLFHPG